MQHTSGFIILLSLISLVTCQSPQPFELEFWEDRPLPDNFKEQPWPPPVRDLCDPKGYKIEGDTKEVDRVIQSCRDKLAVCHQIRNIQDKDWKGHYNRCFNRVFLGTPWNAKFVAFDPKRSFPDPDIGLDAFGETFKY